MKAPYAIVLIALAAFAAGFGASDVLFPHHDDSRPQPTQIRGSPLRELVGIFDSRSASVVEGSHGAARSNASDDVIRQIQRAASERSPARRSEKLYIAAASVTGANARQAADTLRNETNVIAEKPAILRAITAAWARDDHQAALDYAQAIPETALRTQAILGTLAGWADSDSTAARRWADAQPPTLRNEAQQVIISTLAESQPEEALALAQSSGNSLDGVFRRWAAQDPIAAAQHANDLLAGDSLPSRARGSIVSAVAEISMQNDADGLLRWIERQPASRQRDDWVATVSGMVALSDPDKAVALAELLTNISRQDETLRNIAGYWGWADPKAAQAWVEAQTDARVQNAAWSGFISGVAANDPVAAASLALRISDEKTRKKAISYAALLWSHREPRAAAQWAAQLADENVRDDALSSVMGWWMRNDPQTARRWIESQTNLSAELKARLAKIEKPTP
jgi:hypothetical protein